MSAETTIPAIRTPKPKKRGSRKLLVLLLAFFMIVLVILFFRSSFSRVDTIEISGNELAAAEQVEKAAGIAAGDQFFLVRPQSVAKRVKAVKAVQDVQVHKHFPGRITIEVKEYPRVAFELAADGKKLALLADGSSVSAEGLAIPLNKPILTGWQPDDPQKKTLCAALAAIPASQLTDISEIKPAPTNAFEDKIKMYTRSAFEVESRISLLRDKLPYLGFVVNEMKQKNVERGRIWLLDQIRSAPFDGEAAPDAAASGDASSSQADATAN